MFERVFVILKITFFPVEYLNEKKKIASIEIHHIIFL